MIPTVWWACVAPPAEHDLSLLSESEIERLGRMRHDADRFRFVAAWSLARRRLGDVLGERPERLRFSRECEHCGDANHGKPRLVGPGPDFSLSHSGERVLLAVGDGRRVGADVEQIGRNLEEIRPLVLHRDEPSGIGGLDLVRLWVRKEALLKVTGHGIRQMTHISASRPPAGLQVFDVPADAGYVAAVAATTAG